MEDLEASLDFDTFVSEFQHTFYNLAYSYVQNEADAEDLCQEIFLKLYMKQIPSSMPTVHMVVPNCGEHMPGFSEKAKAAAPARGIGRGTGAVPSISGARISSGAGGYRFACSPAGNTAAGQISGCHNPISLFAALL